MGFDYKGYKGKDEQKKVTIGEAGFFSLSFPRFPFFPLYGIISSEVKMPTKAEIREAYDSVAEDYDAYMEKTGHAEAQRKMVGLLKDDIKGNVLDVGTGTGIIALEITRKIPSSQVRVTDISEKMLQRVWANARAAGYNNLSFLVDDIEDSVLTNNQFDTVICCLGMLWFIDKDKALREMARICKDRGKIILIEEEGQPLRARKSAFSKRLLTFFSKIEKLETAISLEDIEEKMSGLGYGLRKRAKWPIDDNHGFVGMVFELLPPHRHHKTKP
ncbi:methylase [subsurface metagenome]